MGINRFGHGEKLSKIEFFQWLQTHCFTYHKLKDR